MKKGKILLVIGFIISLVIGAFVLLFQATTTMDAGSYYVLESRIEPNFDAETGIISDSIGQLTVIDPIEEMKSVRIDFTFPKITKFPKHYQMKFRDTLNNMTYSFRSEIKRKDLKKIYINYRTPEVFKKELQESICEKTVCVSNIHNISMNNEHVLDITHMTREQLKNNQYE